MQGFASTREEVSGARLWGAITARFGTPARFFRQHFVANYCPLLFVEASGRNRTPDQLPRSEQEPLFAACDAHLQRLVGILRPEWVIGVGAFAEGRARAALPPPAPAPPSNLSSPPATTPPMMRYLGKRPRTPPREMLDQNVRDVR